MLAEATPAPVGGWLLMRQCRRGTLPWAGLHLAPLEMIDLPDAAWRMPDRLASGSDFAVRLCAAWCWSAPTRGELRWGSVAGNGRGAQAALLIEGVSCPSVELRIASTQVRCHASAAFNQILNGVRSRH